MENPNTPGTTGDLSPYSPGTLQDRMNAAVLPSPDQPRHSRRADRMNKRLLTNPHRILLSSDQTLFQVLLVFSCS